MSATITEISGSITSSQFSVKKLFVDQVDSTHKSYSNVVVFGKILYLIGSEADLVLALPLTSFKGCLDATSTCGWVHLEVSCGLATDDEC